MEPHKETRRRIAGTLSACSLPTFAEELLTETGGAGQTETTETAEPEEPAEPTPEELKAAEIANIRARFDEGLRILEERQKECSGDGIINALDLTILKRLVLTQAEK